MSLHFVKDNVNIDFVGKRKLGFCLSGTLILLALLSMFFGRGLNLGIDFAGGVIAQVQFQQAVADETLFRATATTAGIIFCASPQAPRTLSSCARRLRIL